MKALMETWRRNILDAGHEEEENEDEWVEDDDLEDEMEEIEEWNKEDDYDYPSRKKRRHDRKMNKASRRSWVDGYDEMAALAKGHVGLDAVALQQEAKRKRKPQCHAYNSAHGLDGRFVDPAQKKGSYSMKGPDQNSQPGCAHGKGKRTSANRSVQFTRLGCGRGERHRCHDGSKKYQEALDLFEEFLASDVQTEGTDEQFEAYLAGVIDQSMQRAVRKHMTGSKCSMAQLIRALNMWAVAEKGDLGKPVSKD